jgi:6-bladed beta-propeller
MRNATVAVLALLTAAAPGQQVRHWTVQEEARIGSVDDSIQALTRVGDVLLGQDGSIYIAQPADQTIRVFDGHGQHVRDIGRQGKGPGEFQQLHSIGFLGDTLYATDQALRRVSLFDNVGTFVRSFEFATPQIGSRMPEIYFPTVPAMLLPDRSALVRPSMVVAWLAAGKDRIPLFHLHADGESVDTIVQTVYEPMGVINIKGRRLGIGRVFASDPLYVFLADGSGVLTARRRVAGSTDRFDIAALSLAGDTVFRREFRYEPERVTDGLVKEAVSEIHDRLGRLPEPPGEAQILTALREGGLVPRWLPPVTEIASGLDGNIWIKRERTEREVTTWQVLDPKGTLIATLELGRNQSVSAVSGTSLLVTEQDSLGVPWVIKYRIVK